MKKLLSLLTVTMFAVTTSVVNAQTVQTHTSAAATSKTSKTVHTNTTATPDVQVSVKTHTNTTPRRRYHRSAKVSSTTHVKANGSAGTVQKTTTTTNKSTM